MSDHSITKSLYRSDLLENKQALVIGASKGIGRQCVLSLAACGAKVTALARNKAELQTLENEQISACVADATTKDCLQQLATLPVPDILVNNLGTNMPQAFTEVTDDVITTMFELNILAPFRITQKVVQRMLEHNIKGSIINISSQMGHVGAADRTVYCATKHALEGFTKSLAIELAPQGIRVNAVAPTFINTPLSAPMFANEAFYQSVLQRIPLKMIGNTADVANAVIYLASDAARLVTGTSLKVDGGWTAQ